MAVTCTPAALEVAAKCFCLSSHQQLQVQTYLLAVLNGSATDKNGVTALLAASKCFCLNTHQLEQIQTYLLCQLAVANGA